MTPVEPLKPKIKYLSLILLPILVTFMIYSVFGLTQPAEAWICSPNGYSIRIIDDSVTSHIKSVEAVNDPYFKSFVTSLTNHVSSRFPKAGSCTGNSDKRSMSNLTFVRLPLVTSGNSPLAAPPKLDSSFPGITCRIDSPWVKLAVRNSDKPLIQGVFIWNERQFLGDQALLANPNLSLNSPLVPLSNRLFEKYANDYADSEMLRSPPDKAGTEKRIPSDILWLFRNSPQTTFIPFSNQVRASMNSILKRSTESYIDLTQKLFDQCSASTQKVDRRYKNVLDLRNTISLGQYQIH